MSAATTTEVASPSESTAVGRPRPLRVAVAAAALLLTATLIVFGVVALNRASTLRSSPARANRAVVDSATTAQVVGQVSTGLTAVLSYDYAKPQIAQAAAKRWLTGDAPKQYATLVSQLATLAKGQQLTLTARVVSAGVNSLRGGRAQLLVFVDQQSTRASDHQTSVSAAQVQITAVRHGSTWAISELKPL